MMLSPATFVLACLSVVVSGHISMNPPVSPQGYGQANIRLPHGCNGSETTAIQVTIPVGISSVKPSKAAGWTLRVDTRPLAVPITSEGGSNITTEVDTLTWTAATPLPDGEYQDFGVIFRLPPSTDGTKFYFPTLQTCVVGSTNWSMIPAGNGVRLAYPAPAITVMANGTMLKANVSSFGGAFGSAAATAGEKSGASGAYYGIGSLAILPLISAFVL